MSAVRCARVERTRSTRHRGSCDRWRPRTRSKGAGAKRGCTGDRGANPSRAGAAATTQAAAQQTAHALAPSSHMSAIVQSIEAQPRAWPDAQAAAGRGVSATINAKLRTSSARNRIRVRPPFTTDTRQPAFPRGPSSANPCEPPSQPCFQRRSSVQTGRDRRQRSPAGSLDPAR